MESNKLLKHLRPESRSEIVYELLKEGEKDILPEFIESTILDYQKRRMLRTACEIADLSGDSDRAIEIAEESKDVEMILYLAKKYRRFDKLLEYTEKVGTLERALEIARSVVPKEVKRLEELKRRADTWYYEKREELELTLNRGENGSAQDLVEEIARGFKESEEYRYQTRGD
ncbi:MAG: hypothetical protein KJ559_01495 [Nanoarchaeota archaeon]|nr:hypothetical protein [Nanoarchaeota archaeon]